LEREKEKQRAWESFKAESGGVVRDGLGEERLRSKPKKLHSGKKGRGRKKKN